MIRRIEVYAAYAVGALTLVGIGLILVVPIATESLSVNGATTITNIHASDQSGVSVGLAIAFFVALAALLISATRTHARIGSRAAIFSVVVVGLTYVLSTGAFLQYIGGAMQYAAIPALLCVVLAFIPARRTQPTQPAPTAEA